MGKVVTSEGLVEFVQSGKFTNVPDHKPPEAKKEEAKPPVEAKKELEAAVVAPKPTPVEAEADDEAEDENGLRPSDSEFSEKTRKRVLAKHRAMKEAKEAAEEAERFAETQFNERKLVENRAAQLEAQLKELEAKIPKAPVEPELAEPVETDVKYKDEQGNFKWKDFAKDLAKFEAANAVKTERDKLAKERAEAEKSAAERQMKERFDAVRKAHPDFDKVIESVKGTEADNVPQHMLNYLFESEKGGELHYYLMKNPVETIRISKMKPILALAELGKLEAKLSEPAKTVTPDETAVVTRSERGGAPAPITPLSGEGSTGIVTDPAKMDYKQLREFRRNEAREKHRNR